MLLGALGGAPLLGTASLAQPGGGLPARVASPTQFGADGQERGDDTRAFEQAFEAGAGGAVVVPPGRYRIQPNRLKLPSRTALIGLGRSSVLVKAAPGVLLEISGAGTRDRVGGCLLRDIVLDGRRSGGVLLRTHHAHDLVLDNVWFRAHDGVGLEAVELWDSRFVNCTWDWCSGVGGDAPSVLLRNRLPGTLGRGDNTNALYFVNCRWESFRDGALWMLQDGAQAMSQIHLVNCKMETSYVRGPFLRMPRLGRNIMVQNLYLCGNGFDRGASRPVDLIEMTAFGLARLENVAVWLNAPVARTVVRAEIGHASCSIGNLWVDGPANPSVAIVEQAGPLRARVEQVGHLRPSSIAVAVEG